MRRVVCFSCDVLSGSKLRVRSGPGPLGPGDLDLAWYAIHTIELLYAVMGPGAEDGYRPLVVEIVRFFATKKSAVPNAERSRR
jgi:hypothetical protein